MIGFETRPNIFVTSRDAHLFRFGLDCIAQADSGHISRGLDRFKNDLPFGDFGQACQVLSDVILID